MIEKYGVFSAMIPAIQKTWGLLALTFDGIKKLISGNISYKNIGGPVTIAQVANQSFSQGLIPYLMFFALFSVNLALLNLLPIPVLDGGHLLFISYEWIIGKPLPELIQAISMRIGLIFLFGLMGFAFYNDILKLIQ